MDENEQELAEQAHRDYIDALREIRADEALIKIAESVKAAPRPKRTPSSALRRGAAA